MLNDSLEQVKAELLNARKCLTAAEQDKFEYEKECMKLKKEMKAMEEEKRRWEEERLQMIQMLEVKQQWIKDGGVNGGEVMKAIQKLSLFVLNRGD